MYFSILVFHTIALFLFGRMLMQRWFASYPTLFRWVGAFLLGTLVGIPVTYIFSCIFARFSDPMLWGTLVSTAVCVGLGRLKKIPKKKDVGYLDVAIVVFALIFGTWLMSKTFHGGADGQLFVGSNNVFDFGMALGYIRSVSWGNTIPIMSPFFAGFPTLYHFFFYFWAALWEYFGVPVVWAVNIPSILSFSALLTMIYYAPQIIAKQKPLVGVLAVFFTITNASLTFWNMNKSDLWHLQGYPFAGPFDSSVISLFVTLNSYVNQRHLAFSIATGLFLFITASSGLLKGKWSIRQSLLIGVLTGLLFGWNMIIFLFVGLIISMLLLLHKQWKSFFVYVGVSAVVGFLFLIPIVGFLYHAIVFFEKLSATDARSVTWSGIEYLWQNLGVLPLVSGAGFLVLPKKIRRIISPLVGCFLLVCLMAVMGKRGFEQKSYSFFIIGINILAAIGIAYVWKKFKIVALATLCVLTISGFVDFMPIKNEFAFPLVSKEMLPLMNWIRTQTPKDAVFVSYEDMIDPVAFAGRHNYYGFFKNIGQYDRSADVRRMYAGDIALAKAKKISYFLVPKWQKNDFPYQIHLDSLQIAYDDAQFRVFRVE